VEKSRNPLEILADAEQQWIYTEEDLNRSPSIIDGMDPDTERTYRHKGNNFITQVGIMLKLPQITLSSATIFFNRFLMRYYQDGDDIYFFGFSRGAYIARFLAEMLDHVGLLSAGNEELVRFVWKTFATWQQRSSGEGKGEEKEQELFRFMKGFRETFSRPVRRIRFLGLFDTVNSVSKVRVLCRLAKLCLT